MEGCPSSYQLTTWEVSSQEFIWRQDRWTWRGEKRSHTSARRRNFIGAKNEASIREKGIDWGGAEGRREGVHIVPLGGTFLTSLYQIGLKGKGRVNPVSN